MRVSVPVSEGAVVSCHLERPLDDEAWRRFVALARRRRILALMRPPHEGEDGALWLERAREALSLGPLGHHTHWTSPTHARPTRGDPAARVREEGAWLRKQGLAPTHFCGGGWYMDERVAGALAELGYADCTATAFRPSYLAPDAPRLELDRPAWLTLGNGRLLELPTTHSLGLAARAALSRNLPDAVHVYFHDTDLLSHRRRLALVAALELLGRRRPVLDLEQLAVAAGGTAPEVEFSAAASAP
jgi:hypothetical protein